FNVERWLDDEHFAQDKRGQLLRVHAATGRSEPYREDAIFARAFATIPNFTPPKGGDPVPRQIQYNADHTAAVVEIEGHLYHVPLDGKAVRLTREAVAERELVTISPDGKHAAFVRGNNLYTVDAETQTERALTSDGGENVRSGKASWVYSEELFDSS